MYISRVPLNGARHAAMELISSPSKMHGAVESSFPPMAPESALSETDDEEGRILWRIDRAHGEGRSAWLYVVSPRKPDFTHLCEQAGWPVEGGWETKDYEALLNRIEPGLRCQFRLKANPVRKVLKDKGAKSKRDVVGSIQGHVTVEQQMQWLIDRSEQHGFRILHDSDGFIQLRVSQRGKGSFAHSGSRATLLTAVFDGLLEVVDSELFRHTLCFGLGRAKAFGCGLMTVVPLAKDATMMEVDRSGGR